MYSLASICKTAGSSLGYACRHTAEFARRNRKRIVLGGAALSLPLIAGCVQQNQSQDILQNALVSMSPAQAQSVVSPQLPRKAGVRLDDIAIANYHASDRVLAGDTDWELMRIPIGKSHKAIQHQLRDRRLGKLDSINISVDKSKGYTFEVGHSIDWFSLGRSHNQMMMLRYLGIDFTTFEDWRDNAMLGTPYIGLGKNLNDRWSVWGIVAGVYGDISNDKPLMDADFYMWGMCAEAGFTFYPFGKTDPVFQEKGFARILESLKQAKPFVTASLGVAYTEGGGLMSLHGPVIEIMGFEMINHHLGSYAVGRIGVDVPLTQRIDLYISGGGGKYLFKEGDELDHATARFGCRWQLN
ncbi:MAG: hypothetical protein ABII01_04305 [Candidatus Woesearchaeota archaeon]